MNKWKSLQELIASLEAEKVEIESRLTALNAPPTSLEEEIILKYIETRSTVKTAEFVKEKGIRSSRGTIYSAGDVSSLIKEGSGRVNCTLLRISREIFNKNSTAVERAYG